MRGPVRPKEKEGGRREGGNVRDPAGSRCASTRPRRWLRGLGSAWGDLSVSAGSQIPVEDLPTGSAVSTGSQIRGVPSLAHLSAGPPQGSPWAFSAPVPGPLALLTFAYIQLASPPLTLRNPVRTRTGPVLCSARALET